MLIQVNTDNHIAGREPLADRIQELVEGALDRFSHQITRVNVHLSDENSHKAGARDIRCVLEARLEGRPPAAVTHQAPTVAEAVSGAAAKLKRSLESTLGRLRQ